MSEFRAPEENADARTWGMLCHLSSLLGLVVTGFLSFLGPLIVWLIKREQYAFVDDQGKEAINFQITIFIITVVCAIIALLTCVGIFLLLVPAILQLVFAILASIAANKGEWYRYPFNIRILK